MEDDGRRNAGYALIDSRHLKQVIGNQYAETVRYLITINSIQTSGSYKVNARPLGYCFAQPDQPIIKRPAPASILRKLLLEQHRHIKGLSPIERHLLSWFLMLDVDLTLVHDTISKGVGDGSITKPNAALATLMLIADNHLNFKRCRWGRIHTPVTRLVKPLRQTLRIDGQPLVGVDVACSQPMILCLFLPREMDGITTALPLVQPIVSQNLITNSNTSTYNPPIPGVVGDIERYISLCESGQLYEHLMTAAGIEVTPASRNKFKKTLFNKVFYGRRNRRGPVVEAFKREFPAVYATIEQMKQRNYRRLAQKMQKAESRLMIDTVCRRLMKDHPDVPVITIHDSILTTPPHVEIVQNIIREAFQAKGLNPTLRIES